MPPTVSIKALGTYLTAIEREQQQQQQKIDRHRQKAGLAWSDLSATESTAPQKLGVSIIQNLTETWSYHIQLN